MFLRMKACTLNTQSQSVAFMACGFPSQKASKAETDLYHNCNKCNIIELSAQKTESCHDATGPVKCNGCGISLQE